MINNDLPPHNLKTAISRMEAAERLLAQCMQKIHDLTTWMLCSEYMPMSGKRVLACFVHKDDTKMVNIVRWSLERKCWDSWNGVDWILGLSARRITHWMPLPDPPEEQ